MEYKTDDQLIEDAEKEMLRRFLDGGNCLAEMPSDCGHEVGKEVRVAFASYYIDKIDRKPDEFDNNHMKLVSQSITSIAKIRADSKWNAVKVLLGL